MACPPDQPDDQAEAGRVGDSCGWVETPEDLFRDAVRPLVQLDSAESWTSWSWTREQLNRLSEEVSGTGSP
jgi:hypothetical protein